MSVYHRFYVKTKFPRRVEQLIIETLGGSAWLESNDRGEFLLPVSVVAEDQQQIQPARDFFRNLVDLEPNEKCDKPGLLNAIKRVLGFKEDESMADENEQLRWYWLPSIIRVGVVEAAHIAQALYKSDLVEVVAEDDEISGAYDDGQAAVIYAEHYLLSCKQSLHMTPPNHGE